LGRIEDIFKKHPEIFQNVPPLKRTHSLPHHSTTPNLYYLPQQPNAPPISPRYSKPTLKPNLNVLLENFTNHPIGERFTNEEQAALEKQFQNLDVNNNGRIDVKEFARGSMILGYNTFSD